MIVRLSNCSLICIGFPLPSIQGVDLVNPTVQWDTGYMAVLTNFTYTPPGHAARRRQ